MTAALSHMRKLINIVSESTDLYQQAHAFGGVLIDGDKILLVQPTNFYGGYVWTFPKGRIDPGETPEETAIREVYEESGYHAEIIDVIPYLFSGTTSNTVYFRMKAVGTPEQPGWETQDTKWATKEEAYEMVAQNMETAGRKRDKLIIDMV